MTASKLAILLILIGVFLRFYQLTTIPTGFYYDEMDHVFTGEAVARYGTDLSGSWSPFSLTPLASVNLMAELPSLFHAGFQLIFGFGAVSGHLPNAFFGLGVIALSMAIVHRLFRQPLLTLLIGAIVATNPWHIHISRAAFEAPISLFFQLLAIFGLIIPSTPIALVGIFCGFLTYHGAKFTLPIIVLVVLTYQLIRLRFNRTILLTAFLSILLLLGLGLHTLKVSTVRSSELINSSYLADIVNDRRRQSLDFPGKNLAINKFTIGTEEILRRYLFVFDPVRLFGTGMESTFQLSLNVFPYFYLSSLPLFILGWIYLWRAYRPQTKLLIILILVSPITSLVTIGYQTISRSALTFILLMFVVGAGAFYLLTKWRNRFVVFGLFAVFALETCLFAANYFGRYPIVAADNHYFFDTLLASYVSRLNQPSVVVTSHPFVTSRSLISYLGLMPQLSLDQRHQFSSPNASTLVLGPKLVVTSVCPASLSGSVILDPDKYAECKILSEPRISLGSPIDSRSYYFLINDPVCAGQILPSYIHITNSQALQLPHLTNRQFCSTWVQNN